MTAAFALLICSQLAAGEVDFGRDVRPILAGKCYACHGPDENHREAGLRLDEREEAIQFGAIEPNSSADSELIRRVLSDAPDEVMPPPESGDALSSEDKRVLQAWIDSGAEYATHWSFVTPSQPDLPAVDNDSWPRNEIDYFVLDRLEQGGLTPSAEADRYTLVRRLYLDLIGLPPTPEQADAFVLNNAPDAYEQLVDSLLDSKHYGEHWARQWLDLARYSDTNGYEKDRERSIWPYRDWVIRSLNADMPFDRFTIEQLAGDMLPNPTPDQLIATGFHRNTMLNEEGGIDPLEYRYYSVVDRVATTGTVWLGTSTGCAQCHTHKYDPITHTDYYSLFALLNNADEPDMLVKTPDVLQKRQEIAAKIRELRAGLVDQFPLPASDSDFASERELEESNEQLGDENTAGNQEDCGIGASDELQRRRDHFASKYDAWLAKAKVQAKQWMTIVPTEMQTNLPKLEVLDDGSVLSTGDITKRDVFNLRFDVSDLKKPITALRLEVLPDDRLPAGGPGRAFYEGRKGDFFLSELSTSLDAREVPLENASHSYGKISIGSGKAAADGLFDGDGSTGWSTSGQEGHANQLVVNLSKPIAEGDALEIEMLFERHFAASLGRFRFSVCSSEDAAVASQLPVELEALLASSEPLSKEDQSRLQQHYASSAPELADARAPIEALEKSMPSFPTTMIFRERPEDNPRATNRHHRGEYLNPEEVVSPAIPAFLRGGDAGPTNRLELARWLVSEENPLVGRVTVNRAWQSFFGRGLQRSSDDFGTQAALPSHPELLDWLSCEFVSRKWSLKSLHRLIVTSATYRQSSKIAPNLLAADPENELLSRGPRFRVGAETIRDMMLRSSGLLSTRQFGPGVRPPQPQSVTAVAYGSPKWEISEGEDRYRRSIYTFSKRTAPFAAFATFDAPSGENCIARRDRSNTPLQALTLLNDAMYLDMARALAQSVFADGVPPEQIAANMFRRVLVRPVDTVELESIMDFYVHQLSRLNDGELSAKDIAGGGASNEVAAWVSVARAIMNLDEAVTKS
ncbi:MAG: PSD1 and planctomycete cytochrome C domain-containing protein [Aureliella sp.]